LENYDKIIEPFWRRLKYRVPLILQGFEILYSENRPIPPDSLVQLQLNNNNYQKNYDIFKETIFQRIGKQYYPIYRMADGEFIFIKALNNEPLSLVNYIRKVGSNINYFLKKQYMYGRQMPENKFEKFKSILDPYYLHVAHNETYTKKELITLNDNYIKQLKIISNYGLLAIHFIDGVSKRQEYYSQYEYTSDWFDRNEIILNQNNYTSFYYIYALLTGSDRFALFKKKNILVITSLNEKKIHLIHNSIISFGASNVQFCDISPTKAMFEKIDTTQFKIPIDIILIGAGIGSVNILAQLKPFKTVCIDAGIVLERYCNNELSKSRIFIL
jgi:hypothetical protein